MIEVTRDGFDALLQRLNELRESDVKDITKLTIQGTIRGSRHDWIFEDGLWTASDDTLGEFGEFWIWVPDAHRDGEKWFLQESDEQQAEAMKQTAGWKELTAKEVVETVTWY